MNFLSQELSKKLAAKEIWADVGDGKYQVSNNGRVRSYGGKHKPTEPKLLKVSNGRSGYPTVALYYDKARHFSVHRLVAEAFLCNPHNWPMVNHKNGNKSDNRVENLEWCTNALNMQHAYRTGIVIAPKKPGEKNPFSKLSDETVLRIRELHAAGSKQCDLAKEFGVHFVTINKIVLRKTWRHL